MGILVTKELPRTRGLDFLVQNCLGFGSWDLGFPRRSPWRGTAPAPCRDSMRATFFQKVIICAIAGFLAAALLEWGKMFVTGADDALNAGYKHTAPGVTLKKP